MGKMETVSWTKTMSKTLPHMQLWANGYKQQTDKKCGCITETSHPTTRNTKSVPTRVVGGYHFLIKGREFTFNPKAIWILSPTSTRYI